MSWFTANNRKIRLTIFEMTLFSMFGALIFASKKVMEFLPNMHLVGMFIILLTVVYRKKALIPLYIYVFLDGLVSGFSMWWIPYLYVWTVLWGMTMLIPKKTPAPVQMVVYPLLCAIHGFLFGALYAPMQAIMFHFTFEQTLAWIGAGLTFDVIHGISNFCVGLLIFPLSKVLRKLTDSVAVKIS